MSSAHHNIAGFSLIEVLLSVTIVSILTGLSLPLFASFQNRNDLDIATQSIADALRRAQTYARGVNGDSQWGIALQGTDATLFKGSSFATRDASYDEVISMPNITPSGLNEILFAKLSGAPNTTGSITLTATNTNETRSVTVNAKGMVTY